MKNTKLRFLVALSFLASLLTLVIVATLTAIQSDGVEMTQSGLTAQEIIASRAAEHPVLEPVEPQPQWRHHVVRSGDTLGGILPEFGLPTDTIRTAAMDIYDLAMIRPEKTFSFLFEPGEEVPSEVRYPLDEDRTLVVHRQDHTWASYVDEIDYDVRIGTRDMTVNSTLWEAALAAGLRPRDIVSIARVLECDVDFNTEIRDGATAQMVVEELWHEGKLVKLGTPLGLRFNNANKSFTAFRFENDDGDINYYDGDGIARRAAFLRSPLEFSRVTSGFNPRRYHPILKTRRPHNGTDFGAPTGTPVRAVSDGVVTRSGWNGGHGKFVKLDHSGPYASSYSHLSRIMVDAGDRVKQGQIIGHVGSTGLATGAHLHYQFWVNGQFVDAMSVDLPRGEKLEGEELERFRGVRDSIASVLPGLSGMDMREQVGPVPPVADANE